MQDSDNIQIAKLTANLKQYDNPRGYKMEYPEVKKKLEGTLKELINYGESCLDHLHTLLPNPETWSSLFALEIIKEIKNKKSISYLIEFLVNNETGDYWEACEEAMYGLRAIGKNSVEPLIDKIKFLFDKKIYLTYLVGALTELNDERVYKFMKEITKDYINDYKKYDSWFQIDSFTYGFEKQEKKECISLLEELLRMNHLSKEEKREIKDNLDLMRNPIKFKEETDKELSGLPESLENFHKFESFLSNKPFKITKKEKEDIRERSETPDNKFEANFLCKDCKERQNIKTGLIWAFKLERFLFENEIMCKHCFSHNLVLSDIGKREILSKQMRILLGKDTGILNARKKVIVEDKKMELNETHDYLLKRIKEEPLNGELYLRAGNSARKNNFYDAAINYYEKAIELNPELIASYLNLAEIYLHRYLYYGIESAHKKAEEYFSKTMDSFNSQEYDMATINSLEYILDFIKESAKKLDWDVQFDKIKFGRNDPCPCGSGKKYKKCCIDKVEVSVEKLQNPELSEDEEDEDDFELSDDEEAEQEDSLWSEGGYIKPVDINSPDFEEQKKYIQEDKDEKKEFSCKKCGEMIGKHNLYWHEGMCNDCFFDEYNM